MANRETFPSTPPMTGDISSSPAARRTAVTGLQGNPISSAAPTDQEVLMWNATDGQWEPTAVGGTACVSINSIGASGDYDIFINAYPIVKINGV